MADTDVSLVPPGNGSAGSSLKMTQTGIHWLSAALCLMIVTLGVLGIGLLYYPPMDWSIFKDITGYVGYGIATLSGGLLGALMPRKTG